MVTYPVFVIDDASDISAFENLEHLKGSLEPIDIHNGEYTAYDRDGYLLILAVSSINYDAVYTIARSENLPAKSDQLRTTLAHGLTSFGIFADEIEGMSYDEVIEQGRNAFAQRQSEFKFNLMNKLRTLFGRLSKSG